jgi:hypothetical protein
VKRILFLLFILLTTATSWADLGGIGYWSNSYDLAPYDENSASEPHQFINIDTVALKTQDMTVSFDYPNKVSVSSDYTFDVLSPGQVVNVAYIPDYTYGTSIDVDEQGDFFVSVNGEKLEQSVHILEWDYSDTFNSAVSALVFPVNFGNPGECRVHISYWYTLKEDFTQKAQSSLEMEEPDGFHYDFSPAGYWAGSVDRITVNFLLNGGKLDELGLINPDDFEFTENGCQWVWENLDAELANLQLGIYYGSAGLLKGEFATVISEVGVNIRSGPGTDYPIIATLAKDERIYVYDDYRDELLKNASSGNNKDTWWLKCRLPDNREGYICAEYEGEYLLESRAHMKSLQEEE